MLLSSALFMVASFPFWTAQKGPEKSSSVYLFGSVKLEAFMFSVFSIILF
jgi:hypothetical protein